MTDPFDRPYAACLFDMDGTILTSIASAERSWARWAERYGLDVEAFLPTIHGVRSIDTIRNLALPGVDPQAEAEAITRAEIEDVADIEPIDGAAAFLNTLPAERWAVVTSAPRALATARMAAAGLPLPALLVTAEDIEQGKPAPDGYLLAARRLGVAASDCLVFEDAAAGIEAGVAAGATVLVVTQTHKRLPATSHHMIRDYRGIGVREGKGGLIIEPKAD